MFAKVFEQIFTSSIARDHVVRHVFMDLLVLADQDGIVDMTVDAIARVTNVPQEIVFSAIKELTEPDQSSRTPDYEGRRLVPLDDHRDWGWRIVNYSVYRKMQSEEARREYFREAQKKHRQKLSKTSERLSASASVVASASSKKKDGQNLDEIMERIRAIGFRASKTAAAEHALVKEVADCGSDPDEIFKALCRIFVWTEQGQFAPKLHEVIPRWNERETMWKRRETKGKGNGKKSVFEVNRELEAAERANQPD